MFTRVFESNHSTCWVLDGPSRSLLVFTSSSHQANGSDANEAKLLVKLHCQHHFLIAVPITQCTSL